MNESASSYRVLLIDDDEDLTRLLADELSHEGFGAVCCSCGEEGLAALESQEFQLVVLDMMLPGLSGEQVLERIRQAGNVPVLILTARGEHDLLVRMLRAGADDYLICARCSVCERESIYDSGAAPPLSATLWVEDLARIKASVALCYNKPNR